MNDLFNNNNMLKLLSILLAVMLWLVVSMDESNTNQDTSSLQTEYIFEEQIIPIINNSEYVVTMVPDKINVTLSGNNDIISKIKDGLYDDTIQFRTNIEGYTTGLHEIPIEHSGLPEGIQVKIEPKVVQVELEAKYSRELPVTIEKLGVQKEGYVFSETNINPSRAYVTGTKELIEQVAFVKAFINVDEIRSTIEQDVFLKAIDSDGNEVHVSIIPEKVNVNIPVTVPSTSVPLVYSINSYPSNGYAIESISVNTKEVTLYGDYEIINSYETYSGFILDLKEYTGNQQLNLNLFEDERLLKVNPNLVEVNIQIVESTSKTFNQLPIIIKGLNDNQEITTSNNNIDVIIEGAASVLDRISMADVGAYIDVSDLSIGEYDVLVEYDTPLYTYVVDEDVYVKIKINEE